MSLKDRLKAEIAATGPITVAEFMARCLHDPEHGYYAANPRLGADGDFITAPLVSQMFGELLGLWAAETWDRLGRPSPVRLVEMGPGDGTLMSDALRALRLVPAFLEAAELWLVETSGPLRSLQAQRLQGGGLGPAWIPALEDVPSGAPLIVIANELLDCLPARQFVRTDRGWAERRVGLDGDGELTFGLASAPRGFEPPPGLEHAPEGSVVEISPAQEALAREVGERIVRDGGAALFVDYGRDRPETGDTLQALRAHHKLDP
jgi:NADH dehydrogenase [ubiquinone] 1 alpha subcomplex assembly factor 7